MNDENKIQKEFMERLRDVEMDVTVRFGQTELPLRDVAALGGGSMIELNRTVDEPVELLVNNCPFARGEVVVVDGYYSVRVTEVSPPEKNPNTFLVDAMGTMGGSAQVPAAEHSPSDKPARPTPKQPSPSPQPQPQQAAKPTAPEGPQNPPAPKPPATQKPPTDPEKKPNEG